MARKTDSRKADPVVWTFTGQLLADGRPAQFVTGIPARALTTADVDELSPEQRKRLKTSGLYAEAEPDKKPKANPRRKPAPKRDAEPDKPAETAAPDEPDTAPADANTPPPDAPASED